MTDLVSKLIVTADAQGVEAGLGRAKKSLASLGATATEVGQQASAGVDKIGDGGQKAAAKVDRATTSLIGSIQRTTAALEAGGRSSTEYYRALAAQRGINPEVLKPYLDSLDAVTTKQRAAAVATAAAGQPLEKYAMSAKATAAAMRGLPAQITDIVVGLQSGQAPLTVLLQQGGQLKDIFGGIGPAARALGGFIVGLVNPFTIAAAAIGAVGLAYFKGSQEADAFRKALVLTGNAAGVTVGQLGAMAASIGAVAGTQHAAADALAQLAATGAVAGEGLRDAAQAAVVFERATGQAIGDTVKQYAELGRAPLEASVKLNESLHYLTLTTYGQIRALEEQGRTAEAAAAAQRAYTDALTSRSGEIEQHLGALERAWRGIKGAAAGAWDAILAVGRPDTLQDQLARVEERIAKTRERLDEARSGGAGARARSFEYELQGNLAMAAGLRSRIAAENGVAEATKKANDQVAARIRFDKEGEQYLTNKVKAEREIAKARNEGAAAGATQAEIEKRIADIRAKYADKGGAPRAPKIVDTSKAELAADLADIQNALGRLQGLYTNSERVLEALRAAGGLSDREYYESKRAFIRLEEAAQTDALQKQIARYEQEKASGKEAIEIQRKIADARAKLAEVGANAATQITISTIQETAAIKAQELAYLSARQAAQDYFDTTQRQQDRALAGLGRGQKQRGFDAGVAQIEDRYAGQRRDLENQRARLELEGKFTADARRQYDERLAIINEFQAKSIDSFSAYYGKLDAASKDWSLGASEALQNYADLTEDLAGQTQRAVTQSFEAMEDALVKFTQTGKLDFKSLADSIIGDIARIAIRQGITGPLAGALNNSISGAIASSSGGGDFGSFLASLLGSFGGGRAGGGDVQAGKLYRVNERGPELLDVAGRQYLMMGAQGGRVTPNSGAAEPSRTQSFHITIAPPAGMTQQTSAQFARDAARQIAMATARGSA